jgi:hypothetical protein
VQYGALPLAGCRLIIHEDGNTVPTPLLLRVTVVRAEGAKAPDVDPLSGHGSKITLDALRLEFFHMHDSRSMFGTLDIVKRLF